MKSLAKHRKKIAKSLAASVKSAQHFVSTLNLKPHNLGAITLLAVLGSLLTPTSVKAVTTPLNFNDTAPTLVSGTALSQGAVYRFKNVTTGVDALVTIATVSNATLTNLDDNANPNATFASRFQPVINHTGAVNTTSYIRFNFQLVVAGTTTPAFVPNVYFSAQDVDGGGANTIREFVQTIGAQVTYIPTPTLLQTMATPPVVGGTAYEQISAANTQPSIGTDDRYEVYSYIGPSVSSFTIIGGNLNGSTGCSGAACPRQNSWTFDVADLQKLDFGDAPSTYGDAYHPVPLTPTVYLGGTPVVDGDDGPNYSANANGDDTNGTDDENGVANFPALTQSSTSYSVTATCPTTLALPVYAWIDFNGNGTFETTERTTGTCNAVPLILTWTGLSNLQAGTTYARFRIGSTASQVSNPTGVASNGEVEDYTLTIAAVPGTISGTLYQDANNDNALTTGETRLPANVDVELLNSAGTVIATVQTNATGNYTFTNVPTGTGYQVRAVTSDPQVPAGLVIGTTNPITAITVTAGATVPNQNFGFDITVSGTLYQDTDGSNAFETGEARLAAGITVTLYNDADNDNVIDPGEQIGSPVTTDGNGNYTFTAIANGTYKLRVDTADSDIPAGLLLGTANNLAVTVNNASVLNQNFGFDPPATLPVGGSSFCAVAYPEVYIGTDANSIYAIHTDTGASSVLTSSALAVANSLATDHNNRLVYYANANSLYAYDVINNTHITITSNFSSFLPTGYTFTNTSLNGGGAAFYNGSLYIGIDTNVTSDILRVNFSADGRTIQRVTPLYLNTRGLAANANWGDFIIGNNGILYGSAVNEGQYWSLDLNNSGSQIVNLNNGTTALQLAKTGDGRLWAFSGTPANVQQIDQTTGALLGTSKATTAAADAGECVRGQATVGDRVWNDFNSNGVQDTGEPGIAGVTIQIYRDINKDGILDAGDPLLGTATTDANGNYTFPDLLPHDRLTGTGRNDFIVRVSGGVPAGATATTPTTLPVDLSTATQIYSTADFGYRVGTAQLLLVKRITRINGNTSNGAVNLTQVVDDPNTTDDNNSNWPANYLVGAINGGIVRPGDELEYTVYFLSSGGIPVKNVSVCDLVPVSTTFVPAAFTSNSGITLAIGSTTPVFLTNASDTDGGQFIVADTETPGSCNKAAFSNPTPPPLPAAQNLAGAVVVDVMTGSTTFPANTTGSPAYGFIRLRAKVK